MKKSFARWLRMNQREVILVLVSLAIIAGVSLCFYFCNDVITRTLIIILSLILELVIGIRIKPQKTPKLSASYFLAYTIGFILITTTDVWYISKMAPSSEFLYAIMISLALLMYVLGLLSMTLPDQNKI